MNLDSERSGGLCGDARAASRFAHRRLRVHPFKKKRELFLISQLSISKYKFNVTIKHIYAPRARRGTRGLFLGNGILTVFPFGSSKPSRGASLFISLSALP